MGRFDILGKATKFLETQKRTEVLLFLEFRSNVWNVVTYDVRFRVTYQFVVANEYKFLSNFFTRARTNSEHSYSI